MCSKDDLFRNADVVTIHLVLSDRTRGLVGAKELGLMKKTAYLVNTSRGPIVDEKALLDALNKQADRGRRPRRVRRRAAAARPSATARWTTSCITPHLGYVSQQNYERYYPDIVENIRGFLDGKPVRVIAPR